MANVLILYNIPLQLIYFICSSLYFSIPSTFLVFLFLVTTYLFCFFLLYSQVCFFKRLHIYHTVFVFVLFSIISYKSIHVTANGKISLFFMMYIYIFIHLSVDGQWGYFYTFAIINNAAINTGVHITFWISIFIFFSNIFSGVELLDHMAALFLVLWEASIVVFLLMIVTLTGVDFSSD